MVVFDIEVKDSPTDSISNVCFTSSSKFLIVSSWDSHVYCYDVNKNINVARINVGSPQLTCACPKFEENHYYAGGLDGKITRLRLVYFRFSIESSQKYTTGAHGQAVSSMCLGGHRYELLISGSWDKSIAGHDPRLNEPSFICKLDKKVYSIDCYENILVAGCADRFIYIIDLRKPNEFMQKRESSLRYQTRSVRCFPDGEGICVYLF